MQVSGTMIDQTYTPFTGNMEDIQKLHKNEVDQGERFEFGANWSRFLGHLNDDRITRAVNSLKEMLEVDDLKGKTFLDIGSGSGLFSLAARKLGAKVFSFDYDTNSVACTNELRTRYFADDPDWTVQQGSALDRAYVESLGKFDIVYSWGVLHHTGKMWEAIENAVIPVKDGGKTFIAIYNDTGNQAKRWVTKKKLYNSLPGFLRAPYALAMVAPQEVKSFLGHLLRLKPAEYFRTMANYETNRGMNWWHDVVDWVGGYPYEYAAPEEIFEFYKARGFRLTKMKCKGVGLGCNEFVLEKEK